MHWRKTTWALVVWTSVFVVWLLLTLADISTDAYPLQAYNVRSSVSGIATLWLLGVAPLFLVWLASRPRRR